MTTSTRRRTGKSTKEANLPAPVAEITSSTTDELLDTEIAEDDEASDVEAEEPIEEEEPETEDSEESDTEDDDEPVAAEAQDSETPDEVEPEAPVIHQISPEVAVKQNELNRALGFAKQTCLNDTKTPLGYLHLATVKGGLKVEGYNRLAGALTICPLANKVQGGADSSTLDVLVPTSLVDLISKEQPDSTIRLQQQGRFLVVSVGDDNFSFKTFPQAYPAIPFPQEEESWEAEGFIEALKIVTQLVGDEGNVLIQIDDDGNWQMEGNQGSALLVYFTPAKAPKKATANFKFTAKALKPLLGFTGKVNITVGDAEAEQITSQRMAVTSDGVTISCEMLIPPEGGKGHQSHRKVLGAITGKTPTIEIDPSALLPKVEKSILLAEKDGALSVAIHPLGLNANVTLTSDAESGGSEQHLAGTFVGKPSEEAFKTNPTHLKNALGVLTTTVAKMSVTENLTAIAGGSLVVLIGHIEGA